MYNQKEKFLALLLITTALFSLFTIFVHSDSDGIHLSAKSAVLYEPESKKFVYKKNENQRLPMASTTKIMTALVVLENIDLDTEICVDKRAVGIIGSSIYLEKEEVLSARSLLYATMLNSANDAAAALAYEICGSIEAFSVLMNDKATALGLKNSNFTNPHGLDDDSHYTSAHDLAIITAEALNNDVFREIISTRKTEIKSSLSTRVLINHNKLLRLYDGCIGVKTGYTKKSGRSLVGAAQRDDLTLISVTIDAPDDWNDHIRLLDFGFSNIHAAYLLRESEFDYQIPVLSGKADTVRLTNKKPIKIIYEGDLPEIKKEIHLKRFAAAPIKCGDTLGYIKFTVNNRDTFITEIIAKENVTGDEKKSFFSIFKK